MLKNRTQMRKNFITVDLVFPTARVLSFGIMKSKCKKTVVTKTNSKEIFY